MNDLQTNPISNSIGRRRKVLISLAILCVGLVVFREPWLMAIGNFLIIEDKLHAADVIHVIAGDDYRTNYAFQLYKQGYGNTIFFTGGWCTFHNYYHGLHGQEVLLAQGVPQDAIAYDEATVTSTYTEAERLKKWIAQQPYPVRSVIVISDPFHMRRARWTYKRLLGDSVEVQMAPVPFEQTSLLHRWWTNQLSRQYVKDEYQKYIYYMLRYQFTQGKIKEWLISLDTQ